MTIINYLTFKTAFMRKVFFLFPLLLLAVISFAQQKTITGTVTGKKDKTPKIIAFK